MCLSSLYLAMKFLDLDVESYLLLFHILHYKVGQRGTFGPIFD